MTGHRRGPKRLEGALSDLAGELEPPSDLARVQSAWPRCAGSEIAAQATPVSLQDGVLGVVCRSSVWAQELDMMGPALRRALARETGAELVRSIRFRVGSPE